jgi:hypothetical protein
MLDFDIEPPVLIPWLTDDERDRNIVLFDMQVDREEPLKLRFDFDVAFNPISVRRGAIDRKDYYIGCTGAEFFFRINEGEILDYTKGSTLNVEYKNQKEFIRNTSLNLNPEVKLKIENSEASVNLGAIKHDKSKHVVFSANFNSSERTLEPLHLNNSIKWSISLPRGLKIVRDYLLGNLYLHVICLSENEKFCGKIKIKPSDVRFFGPDKSPLSLKQSIIMRYILYKKDIDIENADGLETNFQQNCHEN